MDGDTLLLVTVVATALAFDFTNGFHDTANAMATSISTGALRPKVAVAVSAVLNFVGAFLSLSVAATIASGIVDSGAITLTVVFAGLVGGILWNLLTWYLGIPSSSSHALIGGVVGAALIADGTGAVNGSGVVSKVILPALLAPVAAGLVAGLGTYLAYKITSNVSQNVRDKGFKAGQIGSASLVSLAHGTNDAQKTMGIIALALIAHGSLDEGADPPFWVIASCAVAISLGTYMGGWRVIRTLGKGLVEIQTPQGFASEGASASVILASSHFGYPLSTTHVVSGSILGSGIGRRLADVHWSVAGRMATAWLVTLPAAGLVGALAWKGADLIGGTAGVAAVFVLLVACASAFYLAARKAPVNSENVNDEWTGSVAPQRDGVPAGV
ncbi:inorganic phosphate transporter [Motilibacter deserti]|uniref:Phosphate transporter n=1 Tax=Motilibacter deserti TaxID=2714956 RepID=A0ABX0GXK5_9ACTN|nr:inorganic phosphate transporter [Motilibacter deserti]NHC14841.1 inorganic phosphate transporter [Motilibacter deserti]